MNKQYLRERLKEVGILAGFATYVSMISLALNLSLPGKVIKADRSSFGPAPRLMEYYEGGQELLIENKAYLAISLIDKDDDGIPEIRRRKQLGPGSPGIMAIVEKEATLEDKVLFKKILQKSFNKHY